MESNRNLADIVTTVNSTHPGLGSALAFALVATTARKCLLMISPSGFGKSAVSEVVADLNYGKVQRVDAASMASLHKRETELSGFNGVLIVDDLTKAGTQYARIATISTIAELVYSHYVDRSMGNMRVQIRNFQGSAIINMQPVWLKQIVEAPEWDAVIKEKVIRYYHLHRPSQPNTTKPQVKLQATADFDKTHNSLENSKERTRLEDIYSTQFSDARLLEHTRALLRAAASLERRIAVNQDDVTTLLQLSRAVKLERHILRSEDFESERRYDSHTMYLLSELIQPAGASLKILQRHYNFTEDKARRIAQKHHDLVLLSPKRDGKLLPTKYAKKLMKEMKMK